MQLPKDINALCAQGRSRHTAATHLLRAVVDINTIRGWLGHVSVDTTNVYAETDLATRARALAACDLGSGVTRIRSPWRDDFFAPYRNRPC